MTNDCACSGFSRFKSVVIRQRKQIEAHPFQAVQCDCVGRMIFGGQFSVRGSDGTLEVCESDVRRTNTFNHRKKFRVLTVSQIVAYEGLPGDYETLAMLALDVIKNCHVERVSL
jgi:hypothetical protein